MFRLREGVDLRVFFDGVIVSFLLMQKGIVGRRFGVAF